MQIESRSLLHDHWTRLRDFNGRNLFQQKYQSQHELVIFSSREILIKKKEKEKHFVAILEISLSKNIVRNWLQIVLEIFCGFGSWIIYIKSFFLFIRNGFLGCFVKTILIFERFELWSRGAKEGKEASPVTGKTPFGSRCLRRDTGSTK